MMYGVCQVYGKRNLLNRLRNLSKKGWKQYTTLLNPSLWEDVKNET